MGLNNIRVVLVNPLYASNVGAVCRAMKNMGLADLALVAPRADAGSADAQMWACHATNILKRRREFATLAAAVADCGLVAGTTARAGLYRGHVRTPRAWAPRLLAASRSARVALVFGPEDSGLTNADLALCTQLVRIPSSPRYASLNLSHAVMVCGYELYAATGRFKIPPERTPEAPSAMREQMFRMWRAMLLAIGFMEAPKAGHMMLGLRRIFSRGPLSENDVRILIGIARQTQWCAAQMRQGALPAAGPAPDRAASGARRRTDGKGGSRHG
ncbi:MAG: RNA methyltransferase [Kiritimatiellaeota bacterium]|nr:RNA methyltransferase [Kiritimatiellota bacterium]